MSQQTVRPEKWREIVNGNIATAQQHRHELEQSEPAEMNRYQEAPTYARHLVVTARGVYQVTDTLVGSPRPWPWYDAWLARLAREGAVLWGAMRDMRNAEIHGEGADLIEWRVQLPPGSEGQQIPRNNIVLGIPPAKCGSGSAKSTVRWKAYPDRPGSEVGRQYIALCERFAKDFEHDHPAIFGAKA